MKLVRIEVDDTMITESPKRGEARPWQGYLFCHKVFLTEGKRPHERRKRFLRVVEGATENEYLEALAGVFQDPLYVLLEPQKEPVRC